MDKKTWTICFFSLLAVTLANAIICILTVTFYGWIAALPPLLILILGSISTVATFMIYPFTDKDNLGE
jgi:hypothetical protein